MQSSEDPFELVSRFNRDVVKIGERSLYFLGAPEAKWLATALREEADELLQASGSDDLEERFIGQVDACIDAAIFAIGGLSRLGLSPQQAKACFEAVMAANFEKKSGVKAGREGAPDAVKPEGWVGPEDRIKEILFNVEG